MKYMGSKSRIAKYIVPIIQSYIDNNNIKKYVVALRLAIKVNQQKSYLYTIQNYRKDLIK